jgi:serine/threonine protein kinase
MTATQTGGFRILGRELQVLRTVGSGGFGDALLVTRMRIEPNPRHGFTFPPQCVVKVMRVGLCGQTELEQAQREVRVLKSLTHPNIVRYIGSWIEQSRGQYQHRFCIALQYCEGGDVATLIRKCVESKRLLPTDVVVRLMAQVFSALNYSHSRHLIHRDIKPGNVFLTERSDGAVGDAVVGDFGLVRSLEVTCEMVATRVGTPSYVSPEIISGEPYTSKTDIFSAGTMFYELLTCHSPFWRRGLSQQENFKRVLHYDPIPHMRTHNKECYGDALTTVVAACLAKTEKERASAYDVLVYITSPITAFVRSNAIPVYVERAVIVPPAARASPPSATAAPPHFAPPPVTGIVRTGSLRNASAVRDALCELFLNDPPLSAPGRLTALLSEQTLLLVQIRVLLAFDGHDRELLKRQLCNLLQAFGYGTDSAESTAITSFVFRNYCLLVA